MKTVILCGGKGTRLSEETVLKPKPMVEVGGHPILWHIMRTYGHGGFNEFVLALGYKGDVIKDYFLNYSKKRSDFSIELTSGKIDYIRNGTEDWKVHLVDTGEETLTGGRVKRLQEYLKGEDTFMLTYGDGVCDVDIEELVAFHKKHGKLATVTAVRPVARFGNMRLKDDAGVSEFKEKSQTDVGWINGGYFVLDKKVLNLIDGDDTVWEEGPLEQLAQEEELVAYQHSGFWKPMDTLRDRNELEAMWTNNNAAWKR